MPVALKEAMASETACISTTVSAVPELITDGHDGLLVPEKDSDRLASAIQALLNNPDERESLAKNGCMTVNNTFDISESVDTLIEVFESIR
jgi:glycosyltransferase involved in cell wall biosynthesis